MAPDPQLTQDEFLRGGLMLWQPRAGYRVSVDSILLAHWVGGGPLGRVIDLGAGCGVIGLVLARRDPEARVTLAELQPGMAVLARRNAHENRLADRVDVVEVDLADDKACRAAIRGNQFDRVVSSPPFFPIGSGPTVTDESEAIARHELRLTVRALSRAARRLLVPGGRVSIVYPSERLVDLLGALDAEGLRPAKMRLIEPRAGQPANRVLVEAVKGGRGGIVIERPMVVRESDGGYSREAHEALGP